MKFAAATMIIGAAMASATSFEENVHDRDVYEAKVSVGKISKKIIASFFFFSVDLIFYSWQ